MNVCQEIFLQIGVGIPASYSGRAVWGWAWVLKRAASRRAHRQTVDDTTGIYALSPSASCGDGLHLACVTH